MKQEDAILITETSLIPVRLVMTNKALAVYPDEFNFQENTQKTIQSSVFLLFNLNESNIDEINNLSEDYFSVNYSQKLFLSLCHLKHTSFAKSIRENCFIVKNEGVINNNQALLCQMFANKQSINKGILNQYIKKEEIPDIPKSFSADWREDFTVFRDQCEKSHLKYANLSNEKKSYSQSSHSNQSKNKINNSKSLADEDDLKRKDKSMEEILNDFEDKKVYIYIYISFSI